MTALFKNQQKENLPARDRRDWNKIESLGELRSLIANDGYAASFQDMGQYRSAMVRHMDNINRTLAAGQSNVSAWRERMGKPADWPLHAPTDVERAMVAEIAELRAQQAAAPGALPGWQWVPVEPNMGMVTSGFESAPDEFFSPTEEWKAYAEMTGCQKAAHRARLCYAAMLAAAPASPTQAAPAPSQTQPITQTECWSVSDEGFSHDSLGELLENNPDLVAGARVFVGEATHPALNRLIDSDDVIVQMGDRADDIAGEHADGYPDVSAEDRAELDTLLAAWIAKSCPPTFYEVNNVRAYVITEKEIASAQASTSGELQEGGTP